MGIKLKKTICKICKKEFAAREYDLNRGHAKYCSCKCYGVSRSGKKGKLCSRWKGGRIKETGGYIRIYSETHPHKDCSGYVAEHRLVMEQHLGRVLLCTEVVHHINSDRADNRIENLMLFPNNGEHSKYHYKELERRAKANGR